MKVPIDNRNNIQNLYEHLYLKINLEFIDSISHRAYSEIIACPSIFQSMFCLTEVLKSVTMVPNTFSSVNEKILKFNSLLVTLFKCDLTFFL